MGLSGGCAWTLRMWPMERHRHQEEVVEVEVVLHSDPSQVRQDSRVALVQGAMSSAGEVTMKEATRVAVEEEEVLLMRMGIPRIMAVEATGDVAVAIEDVAGIVEDTTERVVAIVEQVQRVKVARSGVAVVDPMGVSTEQLVVERVDVARCHERWERTGLGPGHRDVAAPSIRTRTRRHGARDC